VDVDGAAVDVDGAVVDVDGAEVDVDGAAVDVDGTAAAVGSAAPEVATLRFLPPCRLTRSLAASASLAKSSLDAFLLDDLVAFFAFGIAKYGVILVVADLLAFDDVLVFLAGDETGTAAFFAEPPAFAGTDKHGYLL
jgi:hypothetical protein